MTLQKFPCPECQFYKALIQSTDDYIFTCNIQEDTYYFPQMMVQDFGLPGNAVQNIDGLWARLVHPKEADQLIRALYRMKEGVIDTCNLEFRLRNHHGDWIWMRCRGQLERDVAGTPKLIAGIFSVLGKNNKIDVKTGLLNKVAFEGYLDELLRQPHVTGCVLILGLDNFKHVNDLYNRQFGDEVIRASSHKIQNLLPPEAALFKLDGDEFGIVIENADQPIVEQLYQQIRNQFLCQQELSEQKYYCTVSAGCSSYPQDGLAYADLYKYAEYSLEVSKQNGKDRLRFFTREITIQKVRTLDLTELLRTSIESGFEGFELHYQPLVASSTRRLKGAEALLRWSCSKYGRVPADEFVPLLEKSGLILPVGRWVFSQAVRTCKEWLPFYFDFVMNINLSYLQLKENSFISFMQQTLRQEELSPCHVVVELTESCIASGSHILSQSFESIRQIGLRIAMDDFGTGYSSLSVLKNTPADVVKIDRTFVRDILVSSFDTTFIRFIVALCRDANIETCLEGVETEEEFEAVRLMGLDLIQGYLFGKPQPAQEFYNVWLSPIARTERETAHI